MTRTVPSAENQVTTRSTPVPQNWKQNGLWAFESRHNQSFAMDTTQHPFFKLLWIARGKGVIEFERQSETCEIGDLVIVPANTKHRIVDSKLDPISLYGLGIDVKRLECVRLVLPRFTSGVYSDPKFKMLRIEQRMRRTLYLNDQPDASSQLLSVAAVVDFVAELSLVLCPPPTALHHPFQRKGKEATNSERDPMLDAYIAWLDRNFFESLSLDAAALASAMSRRTFTNLFKARTGTTWLDYVNRLRIDHAEELMKDKDRKITSIAFQCGFDDLSTFYRAYKRIKGYAPRNASWE